METQQKKFVFFLILALIAGVLLGLKLLQAPDKNLPRLKIGQIEVKVEIADSDEARSLGLAGRNSLADDQGMLFVFEQPGQYGFWMKGMNFPLDFVWVSGGRVVEITENIPLDPSESPLVYQPKEPIDAMLEVNAGWTDRAGIKVGDAVVVN